MPLGLAAADCPPGHCVLLRRGKEADHLTLEIPLALCMSMNMQGWSWILMQTLVLLERHVWCWLILGGLWMLEDFRRVLDL